MGEILPTKDWDFDKETQSRILASLEVISCQLANMHKKKSAKKIKPGPQFQPDYVKDAKEEFAKKKKEAITDGTLDSLKAFFEARNPEANMIGGKDVSQDLL